MGRGIDPVHPSVCPSVLRPSIVVLVRSAPLCSAQSAAEEIKFSAGDLFPFSCQRSTASRSRASGDPTVTDGRTDGETACSAVPFLITRKPITPIRERKTFHLNSDCLSP